VDNEDVVIVQKITSHGVLGIAFKYSAFGTQF